MLRSANSLARDAAAFQRLGPEPTEIAPNLWGQESEVFHNIDKYWGTIQDYVSSLLRWRGLDDVMAEEMSVLPGMDELESLLWIAEHHDSGAYDLIVVDAAPTGETLRLLSLPEAGRWWLDRVYPIQRKIAAVTGPILGRMTGDVGACPLDHAREPASTAESVAPIGNSVHIFRAYTEACGRSSMAERQLPKLHTRVRFPSPAPDFANDYS